MPKQPGTILFQVSGREVRELPEATIENAKSRPVELFFDGTIGSLAALKCLKIGATAYRRSRFLDPKFLAQPTPVPTDPDASGETIPVDPDDGQ